MAEGLMRSDPTPYLAVAAQNFNGKRISVSKSVFYRAAYSLWPFQLAGRLQSTFAISEPDEPGMMSWGSTIDGGDERKTVPARL